MHTYIDVHIFCLHTESMSSSNAIVHNTLNFVPLKLVYLKEKKSPDLNEEAYNVFSYAYL